MPSPKPLRRALELAPYSPGLSIAEIRGKYGIERVVKLASNENPLGAPPLAVEAVRKHAPEIFRYPRGGNPRLAAALAALHGVEPGRIAIGNGSDEIIDMLLRIMALPGRNNVVCAKPCFSIYPLQAQICGIEVRRASLAPDFSFPYRDMLKLVDENTRLVFLTNPDNPSGYAAPAGQLEDFAAALASTAPDALLVIDEAYADFAPDEKAISPLAAHILPVNAAFLRTMSKSWGLAGIRVGYGVMPPLVAGCFWRARLPFSVNALAEEAALAALDDDYFRKAVLECVSLGRDVLSSGLAAAGCRVYPSAANFLMFQLPARSLPARSCFEKLLARGIIIRPLASYGLPDYLRVSVGTAAENTFFLENLREILDERA